MLDRKKVFVEGDAEEVDIATANRMGPENAISQTQLKDLKEKLSQQILANDDLKRQMVTKEETLKSLADQARNEKTQTEKQLYQTEFLVAEKNKEIEKIKHENMTERNLNEGQIKELQEKVSWFRENQKILGEQQQQITLQNRALKDFEAKMKQAEADRAKARELEKKCKLLEETIKAKNPNSIPMMIQASKDIHKAEEDEMSKK